MDDLLPVQWILRHEEYRPFLMVMDYCSNYSSSASDILLCDSGGKTAWVKSNEP